MDAEYAVETTADFGRDKFCIAGERLKGQIRWIWQDLC